jgi:exodeoxyribonuclease VII large subunit
MQNQTVLTVSQLNHQVRYTLEKKHPHLWVEGEISGLRKYPSGHIYYTLTDTQSEISAVMFSENARMLSFKPENGMKVMVEGDVSIYIPRGQYQLRTRNLYLSGKGDLWQQYEFLKQQLTTEGIFDIDHKQKIPRFPQKVAVITSSEGAVIRDIIQVLNRRSPQVNIMLRSVSVQGINAVSSIIQAISEVNQYNEIDAIIVGRGGGSMEDLWCFNDESVVRAIYKSKIPIISAVGHETDFTLSDFAADLRAPTPSAAAELVSPVRDDLIQYLDEQEERLLARINTHIFESFQKVENIKLKYGFHQPKVFFNTQQEIFDTYYSRLINSTHTQLLEFKQKLEILAHRLVDLNPTAILNRGYAMVYNDNHEIIKPSIKVKKGDNIHVLMSNIDIDAEVKQIKVKK